MAVATFGTFALERAAEVVNGIPADRRVVLLGESTHGTEEFYRIRAAVPPTMPSTGGRPYCSRRPPLECPRLSCLVDDLSTFSVKAVVSSARWVVLSDVLRARSRRCLRG